MLSFNPACESWYISMVNVYFFLFNCYLLRVECKFGTIRSPQKAVHDNNLDQEQSVFNKIKVNILVIINDTFWFTRDVWHPIHILSFTRTECYFVDTTLKQSLSIEMSTRQFVGHPISEFKSNEQWDHLAFDELQSVMWHLRNGK